MEMRSLDGRLRRTREVDDGLAILTDGNRLLQVPLSATFTIPLSLVCEVRSPSHLVRIVHTRLRGLGQWGAFDRPLRLRPRGGGRL
jgi:hypothetical protein